MTRPVVHLFMPLQRKVNAITAARDLTGHGLRAVGHLEGRSGDRMLDPKNRHYCSLRSLTRRILVQHQPGQPGLYPIDTIVSDAVQSS
jgi:hypothetical protein